MRRARRKRVAKTLGGGGTVREVCKAARPGPEGGQALKMKRRGAIGEEGTQRRTGEKRMDVEQGPGTKRRKPTRGSIASPSLHLCQAKKNLSEVRRPNYRVV